MAQDPYRVLGVAKSADAASIKSAFRKLAKQHHPDTAGSDDTAKARAQARFAEVNQAYEILGDDEKRQRFDRGEIDADGNERATFGGFGGFGGGTGRRQARDPFGAGGPFADMGGAQSGQTAGMGAGMGAEDILRQMFGGGGGGFGGNGFGSASQRATPPPPETRARVTLSISDLLGSDKVNVDTGTGRKLAVAIPAGTRDGDTIRLRGQGQTDAYGQQGDLLLDVLIRPEKGWSIRGSDLLGTFDASLDIAVNGGKATARTPRGTLALKVTPWTDGGKTFRLKGKGLPAKKGTDTSAGDMILTMNVTLPEDQPEALATLLKRMSEA